MSGKSRKQVAKKQRLDKLANKSPRPLHKAIGLVKERMSHSNLFIQAKMPTISEINFDNKTKVSTANIDWLARQQQEERITFGDSLNFDIKYIQTLHNRRRTSNKFPIAFTIKWTFKF